MNTLRRIGISDAIYLQLEETLYRKREKNFDEPNGTIEHR